MIRAPNPRSPLRPAEEWSRAQAHGLAPVTGTGIATHRRRACVLIDLADTVVGVGYSALGVVLDTVFNPVDTGVPAFRNDIRAVIPTVRQ